MKSEQNTTPKMSVSRSLFISAVSVIGLPFLLVMSVSGCVKEEVAPPPPPPENTDSSKEDLIHTIRFNGETLGLIARWYTGKTENWTLLVKANPQAKPTNLKLGQTIRIPGNLVINRNPLPQLEVKKAFNTATAFPPKPVPSPKKPETAAKPAIAVDGDIPANVGGPTGALSSEGNSSSLHSADIITPPTTAPEVTKPVPPVLEKTPTSIVTEDLLTPPAKSDPVPQIPTKTGNSESVAAPENVIDTTPSAPPLSDKDLEREKLLEELLKK